MGRKFRINSYDNAILVRDIQTENSKSVRWVNERGHICSERKNSVFHGYYDTKVAALIGLKMQWKRDIVILKAELEKKNSFLNQVIKNLEEYDL